MEDDNYKVWAQARKTSTVELGMEDERGVESGSVGKAATGEWASKFFNGEAIEANGCPY
jgi:hypothetical protein